MKEKKIQSRIVPVLIILTLASLIATGFIVTRPRAELGEAPDPRIPVETIALEAINEDVTIHTMGTVIPAKKVTIQPEINGRITWISEALIPGASVKKDQILAKIDSRDYQIALSQERARLQEARSALEIELGRQEIAREEWELMKKTGSLSGTENTLVLRKPQLENVQAMVTAAEDAAYQAEINLQRTVIKVPFNATILAKNAELGQLVSPQHAIATLVGNDTFWVQASIPMKHLPFVKIRNPPGGERGSTATVIQDLGDDSTIEKKGEVIQILTELTSGGRMAGLLVEVADPLDLDKADTPSQPLLLA